MFYKIIFTLIIVVGLVFFFRMKRTGSVKPLPEKNPNIPNAFRTKSSALSVKEQGMLKILQDLTHHSQGSVFPKPQLATFITLDPSLAPELQVRLNAELKQISCDFMIVDRQSFAPIIALSFEPSLGLQKILQDLNIPLISLNAKQDYDEEKLKILLTHYL